MKGKGPSTEPDHIDTLTIFTMLVRCPRSGPPVASCPFALFRDQYSLEEKFQLAESFPAEQRLKMMAVHNHCLAQAFAEGRNKN